MGINLYTVNFHFLKNCNLRCKFCYAHFNYIAEEKLMPVEDARELIRQLKDAGCRKLNFAGGEPLLHPHLGRLIEYAHSVGLKTSMVTNGTLLRREWLERYGSSLNWIAISCDSANEEVQKELGRGGGKQVQATWKAFELIKQFNEGSKRHQIRTKLNSVVTRLNWEEDMSDFVLECGIERWKIFQVLYIAGENDHYYPELKITRNQFFSFFDRHLHLESKGVDIAEEDNDAMTDSYIMIDPEGRFFQNSGNKYTISDPILQIGVEQALHQVGFAEDKFLQRGGLYDY